jgi:phage FluMu gp28-like protein
MWVCLSAGERQSRELMRKVKTHAKAYSQAIKELETNVWDDKNKKNYKVLEVQFPNGSRVLGLPANPDTAVGWSANILLDEFSKHRDSSEIWKAMFPTILRGYSVRVIFTFKGKANKAYDLFHNAPTLQSFIGRDFEYVGERGGWSKHFVDIYQAIDMGLELRDEEGNPIEPDDLRLALGDNRAWAEDFECIASDETSAFITYDVIAACSDAQVERCPEWVRQLIRKSETNYQLYKRTKNTAALPIEALRFVTFPDNIYVGYDVARKRHLSVIWVDAKIKGVLVTVAVIDLDQTPFFVQKSVLHTILRVSDFTRACIDESGIGAQMAEETADLFGSHRVEGIPFVQKNKEMLAFGLQQNFDDQLSLIPEDKVIRDSINSVKKYPTGTGHFRFDAETTKRTGHADHFWAKALAIHAASEDVTGKPEHKSVTKRIFSEKGAF